MIKAKKSLGQNFLKDDIVLQKIIEKADLSIKDIVIEIGPGQGALTEKLANICKKVIAVEIDSSLIKILSSRFHNNNKIEIINADILKINLPELVKSHALIAKKYKLVANLPYYITSPIIRLFLETKFPPEEMILMVQKEVAERICAKKGKMSILALAVQYYSRPEYLFTVPAASFNPIPKVESAVIKIANISHKNTEKEKTKKFFRLIRAGFSAKRKTLANNLSNSLKLNKEIIEESLKKINLCPNVRAQELSLKEWEKLLKIL